MHGERVGIGTIIMSKLHGVNWKEIRDALQRIRAPTTAKEIDVDKDQLIDAMVLAKKIRPERFTILNQIELNRTQYQEIFAELGILD